MEKENFFPKDWDDFKSYVEEIENSQHDYNSITHALVDTTVAFFNYFASKHGMTGFQAGWANLAVLGRLRGINDEAPFMLINSEDLLYPQYDPLKKAEEFLEESKPLLAPLAKKMIEESGDTAHPAVLTRWKEIAALGENEYENQ